MKVDVYPSVTKFQPLYPNGIPLTEHPLSCGIAPRQQYVSGNWVQLLEIPSFFSGDEALLLCEQSKDEWVAWIPNHGETVLNVSQFCGIRS